MTIEDILDKALSPEHARIGGELQEYVSNIRMPLFIKFFKQGLSPADRTAFELLSAEDQVKQLQDKHYMLKPDMAEKFVNYLSAVILKKIDANMGSQLEAAIAKMNDASLNVNDRHAASMQVNHLNAILQSYGFNSTQMVLKGAKEGFSPEVWNEQLRNFGEHYRINQHNAAMALVTPAEAEHYLTTVVKPATGLNVDAVKTDGVPQVKAVAAMYHQFKNDLEGFKKHLHQYH